MNVRTNHCNGRGGVSPPEPGTPCHTLFPPGRCKFLPGLVTHTTATEHAPELLRTPMCVHLGMHVCAHMGE